MPDSEQLGPRKGDRLFRGDCTDWRNNACVSPDRNQWWAYAEGYKRAADLLVEKVTETQFDQNFLVFPIVFLYRQYLELRLKGLIIEGSSYLDEPRDIRLAHDIRKLWIECRGILERIWPETTEEYDAVGECIEQFSELDPKSTSFRYPMDKDGNPSITESLLINLRNLAEVIGRTAALLDGSSIGISVYQDGKNEMEWYYGQDMGYEE